MCYFGGKIMHMQQLKTYVQLSQDQLERRTYFLLVDEPDEPIGWD